VAAVAEHGGVSSEEAGDLLEEIPRDTAGWAIPLRDARRWRPPSATHCEYT
jgi:hypothetical protein